MIYRDLTIKQIIIALLSIKITLTTEHGSNKAEQFLEYNTQRKPSQLTQVSTQTLIYKCHAKFIPQLPFSEDE